MAKCDNKDCEREATHRPVFYIRAHSGEPAIGHPDIRLCSEHANAEAADDLLLKNADGKAQIERALMSQGLAAPVWDRCTVEFEQLKFN